MVLEKEVEGVHIASSVNNFDLTGLNERLDPAHQNPMEEGKLSITVVLSDNLDKSWLIFNGTIDTGSNTKVGILVGGKQ